MADAGVHGCTHGKSLSWVLVVFWDYYRQRFERDRGLKIDFVLASASLAERVTAAFVDRDERDPAQGSSPPSDHAPVVVDLAD